MSNTIRIRTTPNGGDKYVKVNLEQEFDFVEILSLKLTQEEVYRNFCADYGVIVGRVIVNGGFGVPNAKVSVFIPIDEVDAVDPTLKGLYPYETVTDKNSDGVRYNLLPKSNQTDNDCYTPVGTFPTKREILDDSTTLDIYKKYYKYTSTTNHAGDFMIFGVPVGNYTVHIDTDISDIGILSQRPYDLIRQGSPAKLFDSPTKFKGGTNLDKLPQIKTTNIGVNVQPFWGDMDNCQIGISRVDVDLNYNLVPAAIFMGSIYGDQDKYSINKNCRPKTKLGQLCEQVTGAGTINMIRRTLDDTIEEFDVEGGQLIDDDGTWAYQIPMNLDYMVTDEEGNLIPSNDPNVGIPTRASVRFKIGMYETGGEGRLRTRAKYLVPNNPKNKYEIDYDFGDKTKVTSFKNLQWNKIYTVSNFIARYQPNDKPKNRNMIGMKNVDDCSGDKTPFPYNRVNTEINPLFFIICSIINILSSVIYLINYFIIWAINLIINTINVVLGGLVTAVEAIVTFINNVTGVFTSALEIEIEPYTPIPLIPCISIKCPTDDGEYYAPGCSGDSWLASQQSSTPPSYTTGLDDCMAFETAKALNTFQFDFYNDWVNGSLYGFLLKYKKKRNDREVFCEYDCDEFISDQNYSGVDSNQNGNPDNGCVTNLILDTCYNDNTNDSQLATRLSLYIKEGLIKKYEDEFYYAATTHDTVYKLFATDIICLGSILNTDWQGIPKIQQLLTPTSYKLPPDVSEYEGSVLTTCGMVNQVGGDGLFFSIDCFGVHMNYKNCLNVRHICEIGVDLNESTQTSGSLVNATCTIGSNEISNIDKDFRNTFVGLNNGTALFNFSTLNYNTDFNLSNLPTYDFTSYTNNGNEYISFRGYNQSGSQIFSQPKQSLYTYFGLLPGKTALDKMNYRFFSDCAPIKKELITLDISLIKGQSIGALFLKVKGGYPQYTYTIYGPNNYLVSGSLTTSPYNLTLNGLSTGEYIIEIEDSYGNPVNKTIII